MAAKWDAKGKTFLVTGGASGLGAMYTEAFLKEGAKSIAIADIAEEVGKATASRLNTTYPGKVTFYKCDVSKEEEIDVTFKKVVDQFGQLDVVINNAGIMSDAPNMWRTASDVNWQGVVSFSFRAQKHMRKDEGGVGGTIINIASTAGINRFKPLPAYSGSKAAVLHFSMCLAAPPFFELTGVRVVAVCLGATDTPLLQGLKARAYCEQAGDDLEATIKTMKDVYNIDFQKPENAVTAMLHIFKEASPGSAWMPTGDKPVRDITDIVNRRYEEFESLVQ